MRRGTTPTITATVNADLSDMGIHLAFKVGCTLIVKTNDELEITVDGGTTTIKATLTQEETLAMKSGDNCEVQIRAVTAQGRVAIATSIGSIPVRRILEEGFIDG